MPSFQILQFAAPGAPAFAELIVSKWAARIMERQAEMAREQRTKLTLKEVGEPAVIKAQPDNIKKLVLGRLVGIATGFLERQSADKSQTFEGLKGSFRVIPTDAAGAPDATKTELESGVLFIPEAFHNMIADNLRNAQKVDEAAALNFAFEVASIRANNPAGYSWSFLPLIEGAAENPLDKLTASLPAPGKVAAIADQSAGKQRARA